jgi:predicted ester cyclase
MQQKYSNEIRAVVTQVRRREPRELLAPAGPRTQSLDGFDDEFKDIVDFIYRITHRIWVEGAIGRIYDYYDYACTVHTPYTITRSVEDVVAGTATMLNAFPDRESHFLNVAWSGDAEQGFYTSHLGFSRMTNRGPTQYGPATNKTVLIRTCADCISHGNRIHTEWLVRDNGALVRQLGFDRHEVARRLAVGAATGSQALKQPGTQRSKLYGPLGPQPLALPQHSHVEAAQHLLHDIWNRRRLDRIGEIYAADAVVHSGGGRVAVGVRNISALVISMLAAIPDAVLRVEHGCWSEERDGIIVAVRWVLDGSTRSGGFLGEVPNAQSISMMGISHLRFTGDKIVEEWTLFDEVAVLVQAYRGAS